MKMYKRSLLSPEYMGGDADGEENHSSDSENSLDAYMKKNNTGDIDGYIVEKRKNLGWGLLKWLAIYLVVIFVGYFIMRMANPYTEGSSSINILVNGKHTNVSTFEAMKDKIRAAKEKASANIAANNSTTPASNTTAPAV